MASSIRKTPQTAAERSWPWLAAAGFLLVFDVIAAFSVSRTFMRLSVFGFFTLALLLVAGSYSARKRALQERWSGTMMMWLKIHIYAALAGFGVAVAHAIEAEGSAALSLSGLTSGKIVFLLLVLVVVTGIIWRLVYFVVPSKVAREVGNLSVKNTRDRIDELEAEIDKLQVGRSIAFQQGVANVRTGLPATEVEAGLQIGPSTEMAMWQEFKELLSRLEKEEGRRKKQRNLSDLMQSWKVIHIPLATLLLAAILYHVVDVYFLRG